MYSKNILKMEEMDSTFPNSLRDWYLGPHLYLVRSPRPRRLEQNTARNHPDTTPLSHPLIGSDGANAGRGSGRSWLGWRRDLLLSDDGGESTFWAERRSGRATALQLPQIFALETCGTETKRTAVHNYCKKIILVYMGEDGRKGGHIHT